jgi:hypothetical protein
VGGWGGADARAVMTCPTMKGGIDWRKLVRNSILKLTFWEEPNYDDHCTHIDAKGAQITTKCVDTYATNAGTDAQNAEMESHHTESCSHLTEIDFTIPLDNLNASYRHLLPQCNTISTIQTSTFATPQDNVKASMLQTGSVPTGPPSVIRNTPGPPSNLRLRENMCNASLQASTKSIVGAGLQHSTLCGTKGTSLKQFTLARSQPRQTYSLCLGVHNINALRFRRPICVMRELCRFSWAFSLRAQFSNSKGPRRCMYNVLCSNDQGRHCTFQAHAVGFPQ